ncbi:hypothetical protein [Subtercola frigoramans]|uniref:Type IV secretion protein Rhs n=1 Tax=Subtercola frigoramans TaxID=120298 RepID=A0ABS2L050_9MICO|nr:hypothetical protein [Subtercola frigoramans]MBM7470460.1 hypothetical protein [Subtercola frigoramans]
MSTTSTDDTAASPSERAKPHKISVKEAGGLGNWLNERLFPYLGPPPLGPFDTATPDDRARAALASACPLCGAPMNAHDVDRSGERTQLHCPQP